MLSTRPARLPQGDVEAALADYRLCGELGAAGGADNPAFSPWRSAPRSPARCWGGPPRPTRLAERELELPKTRRAWRYRPRVARLGMIRGPEGSRPSRRPSQLESSQAALERRALVEFGAALRRSDATRRMAMPPQGLDLAQRCGAGALVVRAKNEAKTAGARRGAPRSQAWTRSPSASARSRCSPLRASNRQIADQLVVTVKTVEWHLGHSFRKLDVDSRAIARPPRALT